MFLNEKYPYRRGPFFGPNGPRLQVLRVFFTIFAFFRWFFAFFQQFWPEMAAPSSFSLFFACFGQNSLRLQDSPRLQVWAIWPESELKMHFFSQSSFVKEKTTAPSSFLWVCAWNSGAFKYFQPLHSWRCRQCGQKKNLFNTHFIGKFTYQPNFGQNGGALKYCTPSSPVNQWRLQVWLARGAFKYCRSANLAEIGGAFKYAYIFSHSPAKTVGAFKILLQIQLKSVAPSSIVT